MTGDGKAGCAWSTAKSDGVVGTAEGLGGPTTWFGPVSSVQVRYLPESWVSLPRYDEAGGIMISLFCCITWANGHLGPTKTKRECFDSLDHTNDKRTKLLREKHLDSKS